MEPVEVEGLAHLTIVVHLRDSPELPGILRNSPVTTLTTLYPIFESPWLMVLKPYLKHALKIDTKNAYKFGLLSER